MKHLYLLFTLILILATQNAYAQFQIIPELGVDNKSKAHLVIADSSRFYVIGEQVGTSVQGFRNGIWPYSSVYDYNGNLLDHNIIIDSTYQKPFVNNNIPFASFKNGLYFSAVQRNIDSVYAQPFIYLINVTSGEIIEGTHIPPPPNINWAAIPFAITYNQRYNTLIFCTSYPDPDQSSGKYYLDIIELDTTLEINRRIQLEFDRFTTPYYVEVNEDHEYIITGDSRLDEKSQPYYLQVDTLGEIIEFNQLDIDENLGSWVFSYTYDRDSLGNWFATLEDFIDLPDSCFNCWTVVPYTLKIDPTFEEVIWKTKIQPIPFSLKISTIRSGVLSHNQNGYVTVGDLSVEPSTGIIYKVDANGDSLWLRKIQPLGWDEGRARFINLNNIVTAPDHSYLVAGSVVDSLNPNRRSWILHLDEDGCLIPGCGTTSIEPGPDENKQALFRVYPNPASEVLYLQPTFSSPREHTLSLFSMGGQLMKSVRFTPDKSVQYMVDIQGHPPGQYVVKLAGKTGQDKGALTFIKQ